MKPVWIFDCDNTLYPAHTGFFERVDNRIREYMALKVGIGPELIEPLRERYRAAFGVTLVGLMGDYGIDPDDYLDYVHDVKLDDLIAPDRELADALAGLGEVHVFTNGTSAHAAKVLARLGLEAGISRIFDIGFMDYVPKPRPHGYLKIVEMLGVDPSSCVMVDDMEENLDTARKLGMRTVLVAEAPAKGHLWARSATEAARLNIFPFRSP